MHPLRPLTGVPRRSRHGAAYSPFDLSGALGWQADSGVFSDTGGSTPCANGGGVALWRGMTAGTPDARQSSSGARVTWVASGLNGYPVVRNDGSARWLALASPVELAGAFSLYAWGNRAAGGAMQLLSREAGGTIVEVYSDGNIYFGVDGGGYVTAPYTGAAGGVAVLFKRDGSDAVTFTATGQSPTALGTRSGTLTPDTIMAQLVFSLYADCGLAALLILPSAVSSDDDAAVRAWGLGRYGTALP